MEAIMEVKKNYVSAFLMLFCGISHKRVFRNKKTRNEGMKEAQNLYLIQKKSLLVGFYFSVFLSFFCASVIKLMALRG